MAQQSKWNEIWSQAKCVWSLSWKFLEIFTLCGLINHLENCWMCQKIGEWVKKCAYNVWLELWMICICKNNIIIQWYKSIINKHQILIFTINILVKTNTQKIINNRSIRYKIWKRLFSIFLYIFYYSYMIITKPPFSAVNFLSQLSL